jgi:four helix bundle protein
MELQGIEPAAELRARTRVFALRVARLLTALPRGAVADVLGRQLLRCGTSVGANFRAACRARSRADFIAKMGIVEEETDESIYWMELIVGAELMPRERIADLMQEADELLAIFVASIRTAKRGARKP